MTGINEPQFVLLTTDEAIGIMRYQGYAYSSGLQFFIHNDIIYREFSIDEDSDTIWFKTVSREELDDFAFYRRTNESSLN